jgi:hypothetical protein
MLDDVLDPDQGDLLAGVNAVDDPLLDGYG